MRPEQPWKWRWTTLVCSSANALPFRSQTWAVPRERLDLLVALQGNQVGPHQGVHRREIRALQGVVLQVALLRAVGTA